MLKYTEREVYTPPEPNPFTVTRSFEPVFWDPPLADQILLPFMVSAYRRYHERLLSETGKRKSDVWNKCEHYKAYIAPTTPFDARLLDWACPSGTSNSRLYVARGAAQPLLAFDPALGGPYTVYGEFGKHVYPLLGNPLNFPSMTEDRVDGGFVPPPPHLDELVDASLKRMLPHIKDELSLVNSIIELKDFASLPRTLSHLWTFASKVPAALKQAPKMLSSLRAIRKSFSGSAGPTLRETLRLGADAFLQTEFNILPLIRDIRGIYTALVDTERRIRALLRNQGRRRLKHFVQEFVPTQLSTTKDSCTFSFGAGQFAESYGYSSEQSGCVGSNMTIFDMDRYTVLDKATFHAQIEYNYTFTQFQVEHARILALLDGLGFNMNPAIIWNAIPWTFLVDWVLSVSKWLSARKRLNMEPTVNITKYLWSCKTTRRVRCVLRHNPNFVNRTTCFDLYLPDLWETTYRRDPGIPYTNPFFTGEIDLMKISLGAALVITRKFRPKNWRGKNLPTNLASVRIK